LKLIKGRLKAARTRKELTLCDVEALTDRAVTVSCLSNYERGLAKPSCEKIELLTRVYEVPMSYVGFCPYLGGKKSQTPGREGCALNPSQVLEEVKLTSQELEILGNILEKLKQHK
jgi:transcriptional regulator with XRE-family HTH domain